jgi:hypothetical protein
MLFRLAAWYVMAGVVCCWPAAVQAADKADEPAKEIVTQFARAVKAENLDEVMKLVEVPWFHDSFDKILRNRDELRKELRMAFDERDFTSMTFEISRVDPYQQLRDKAPNEEERKVLDEILGKDGRVVTLEVVLEGEKRTVRIGVRTQDGKARVVGVKG